MAITGPLFKWFGSKWSASKYYPKPEYFDYIIEPFAGSAGYSLRYCDKKVTIAESDRHIFNLWSWLIDEAKESDIREIPINIKEETDIRSLGLTGGQQLLIKNWQRTNNIGNCWTISPWGNLPGQWTENTRNRVASEFHQIKHWKIVNDGLSLLQENHDATWFIDPPYQYNFQYKSLPFDYKKLGKNIEQLSGQVIVCEAVCQKTGQVPDWLPFIPFRKTITSRRKANNHHHSNELMYVKG